MANSFVSYVAAFVPLHRGKGVILLLAVAYTLFSVLCTYAVFFYVW
jgi:hypothetical protein